MQALLSPAPRGFAARSRVLARLASLAQIGELARRLPKTVFLEEEVANVAMIVFEEGVESLHNRLLILGNDILPRNVSSAEYFTYHSRISV